MEQLRELQTPQLDPPVSPEKFEGEETLSVPEEVRRGELASDDDADTVDLKGVKEGMKEEARKLKERLEASVREESVGISDLVSSLPIDERVDGENIATQAEKELDHLRHELDAASTRLERSISEEIFDITDKKWTEQEKREAMDTALAFWGDILRPVKKDIVLYASTTTYLQGRMMQERGKIDPTNLKDEYTKYPGDLDVVVANESTLNRIREYLLNTGFPIRFDNFSDETKALFNRYPDGSVRFCGTIDIPVSVKGKTLPFPYEFEIFFQGSDRFLGRDLQKRKMNDADSSFGLPILQKDAHKIQYENNLRFESKIEEATSAVAEELRRPEIREQMENELLLWENELKPYQEHLAKEPEEKTQEHVLWQEKRKELIRDMRAFAHTQRYGLTPEEIKTFYSLEERQQQQPDDPSQDTSNTDKQTRVLSGGSKSKASARLSVLDALMHPFRSKKDS